MSQIPYIDSHVHLDRYPYEQCIAMLDRAARAGVHTLLTVGVDVLSSTRAMTLARQFGTSHGVVAAVGLHPAFPHADMTLSHETIEHSTGSIARLEQAELERVVAIGEIGLDTIDARGGR